MVERDVIPVRDALRLAVTDAMKRRDRGALATYRTALAAIDNAEAVPLDAAQRAGAIESSAVGPGSTDAARLALTEPEMIGIVLAEAEERGAAAASLAASRPEVAAQLRREADLLRAVADGRRQPMG